MNKKINYNPILIIFLSVISIISFGAIKSPKYIPKNDIAINQLRGEAIIPKKEKLTTAEDITDINPPITPPNNDKTKRGNICQIRNPNGGYNKIYKWINNF